METTSSPTSSTHSTGSSRQLGALAAWLVLVALQVALAFSATSNDDAVRDSDPLFSWELAVGGTIVYAVLVGLTFAIVRAYPMNVGEALGLKRFESRWVWIALGVAVASLVVAAIAEPFLHGGEEQGLAPGDWQPDRAGAFVANALVVVVLAPFAEELFFRGLGVRVLRFLGPVVAVGGTAVLFGLAHGILGALPPLIAFGVGLAWVRYRSDSVWPCFVSHAIFNGIGIAIAIATF
ncbi:MAG: CPBP family intramembrane glutamic endopeptidase [Gaiellaceae bacterium]